MGCTGKCHISNVDELVNSDAFARARVSTPYTIFDSKQIVNNSLFFDDQEFSGGGTTSAWSANRASTTMGVTALTAGKRIRQTFQRFNYQPGKSQLFIETFVMGDTESGVVKEVGLFDDKNGLFLRNDGGAISFVIRNYVTGVADDAVIPQASWNQDVLDGSGNSRITLDITKAQIFFVDFEWLGVGTVRFGFFFNGKPVYAHYANHANSISSVYISTPNLPLRYSIEGDGTAVADDTFEHICSTVISEGSLELTGIVRSIDRGITPLTTLSSTSIYPLLSARLKTNHEGITTIINELQVFTTANVNYRWVLLLNPTVAGLDAAAWVALANSAIEYDISRTTVNTLTGGLVLAAGYAAATNQSNNNVEYNVASAIKPGISIAGVKDQIILAVQNLANGTNPYYGELSFRELL